MRSNNVKRAAIIWGKTQQHVRTFMRNTNNIIGATYVAEGCTHHTYHVEDNLLRKYIGEDAWCEGVARWEALQNLNNRSVGKY